MNDIAIRVENLGKQYRIGGAQRRHKTFQDALLYSLAAPARWLRGKQNPVETFWALDDISFEIKQGEAVGIIGRNGAGKSTLLKVLSRITKPTKGRIDLYGRVASLLEVGTGFHSELSGRDNIYLNGAILGMNRTEIERKFDEIVDFSGVEKFLDTPVKHYSSGMYVRLAFAVAAHLEPEILIVDEVLAVGDAEFQKKCLGKMSNVAGAGRTVLFVSHNMAAIQSLCTSAYLLSHGNLVFAGETETVINKYLEQTSYTVQQDLRLRKDRTGNQSLKFVELSVEDTNGNKIQEMVSGKDYVIVLSYESQLSIENVSVSIGVYGNHGQFLMMCNNDMAGYHFDKLPPNGQLRCSIPKLPFSRGVYRINLYCEAQGVLADWIQDAAALNVVDGDFHGTGKVLPPTHSGFLVRQIWSSSKGEKIEV